MKQIELELAVSYSINVQMDVNDSDIDSINDIMKHRHGRIDLNSNQISPAILAILENAEESYGDDFEYTIKGLKDFEI